MEAQTMLRSYRQGDVLIFERNSTARTLIRTETGPFLLAEGEKEGHKHLLVADDPIEILLDDKINDGFSRRVIAKVGEKGATLTHDTHAPVAIAPNSTVEFVAGQKE